MSSVKEPHYSKFHYNNKMEISMISTESGFNSITEIKSNSEDKTLSVINENTTTALNKTDVLDSLEKELL